MTDIWRFIDSGNCSAAYNMAMDEAIAVSVRKEIVPPTLRLYGWNSLAVSIGCFQKTSDIDAKYCTEKDIPIVRRLTGGRAILHGEEVTYSFSIKTMSGLFSKGLFDSYKKISAALILAMSKIGLSAEIMLSKKNRYFLSHKAQQKTPLCLDSFSYGEITVNNKKIIGSAQKRWTDGLLQQGTIPLVINKKKIIRIFKLEHIYDLADSLIGLKDLFSEIDADEFKNYIRNSFEETFNIELIPSFLSEEEIQLAREIEVQKYMSDEWNFRR
jgi:lipoate-protein ligase A